jgi:hypothetical protein
VTCGGGYRHLVASLPGDGIPDRMGAVRRGMDTGLFYRRGGNGVSVMSASFYF